MVPMDNVTCTHGLQRNQTKATFFGHSIRREKIS